MVLFTFHKQWTLCEVTNILGNKHTLNNFKEKLPEQNRTRYFTSAVILILVRIHAHQILATGYLCNTMLSLKLSKPMVLKA
jgi:hypothetical protein